MRPILLASLIIICFLSGVYNTQAQTYAALKAENTDLKAKITRYELLNNRNRDIKQALLNDTAALQKALELSQSKVNDLKNDKESIRQNLKDMEAWGVQQQKEKLEYYSETQIVRGELADAKQKYLDEKAKHEKTKSKYHRIKTILGAAVGLVLLLLYFRFGSPMVSQMAKLTGAWSPIIEIFAPIAMFGIGFLIVFLIF